MRSVSNRMIGIIGISYLLIMIYINVMVMIVSPNMDYPCKREIVHLSIFAVALVCVLGVVTVLQSRYVRSKCMKLNEKTAQKIVTYGCIIFCMLQIYMCFNYYFLTDWDVDLIYQSATELANGTFESAQQYGEFCWYYSTYPNNMELLGVFVACLKLNQYFGALDPENGVMVFIALNCVIMSVTGHLLYQVITQLFSHRWGLAGWIIYVLFIGLSPWVVIPYSDPLGFIFPTLELWLFLKLRSSDRKWPYSILLGVVSGIGYYVKPQTIIMLLAIGIVVFIHFLTLFTDRNRCKRAILLAVLCVFSVYLSSFVPKATSSALGVPLDPARTFGASHFVMMGMNPEKRGVYSQEDCDFSHSFGDAASRKQGEIAVIKDRLKQYGVGGYFYLLNQKLLTTYGDGTFAWGFEGSFWKEIPPLKNSGVSVLLREFYYRDGKHFSAFIAYMQFFWISTLLLSCFSYKRRNPDPIFAVQLGVIGLTMFELLFEARARYLYTFSPLFLLLAVCGARNIYYMVRHCLCLRAENARELGSSN